MRTIATIAAVENLLPWLLTERMRRHPRFPKASPLSNSSSSLRLDPTRTALLVIDLQNDMIHPDGVYARNGVVSEQVRSVAHRLRPLADRLRERKGWLISNQFTIVSGHDGQPFISDNMRRLRPFLSGRDFRPGSWGHKLVDELGTADLEIEKIAYSAFYMTRLEWVLWQARVDTLLIAGVATHVSVAATMRDALVRDFKVVVVEDGCAAFDADMHTAGMKEMANATQARSVRDLIDVLA
jgi:ureidoacrylate peracid hydrolase